MALYQHRTIVVGDIKTHFLEAGSGPDLILLHGGEYGASAEITWRFNFEGLSRRFHVVAPDILGWGQTDKLYSFSDPAGLRIKHMQRFLEALGIGRARFAEALEELRELERVLRVEMDLARVPAWRLRALDRLDWNAQRPWDYGDQRMKEREAELLEERIRPVEHTEVSVRMTLRWRAVGGEHRGSAALAASTLAVAAPAAAQWYPPQPQGNAYGYKNYGQVRRLDARIDAMQRQISHLDRRNILSEREARSLRSQSNDVERRLRVAARNGLNGWEANDIERRVQRLEVRIQREARDGNGWRNGQYNNAGWSDRDRDGRNDRYEDDRGYDHD